MQGANARTHARTHLDAFFEAAVTEHVEALGDDSVFLLVLAHRALDHLRQASSRRAKRQLLDENDGATVFFYGSKCWEKSSRTSPPDKTLKKT